MKTPFWIFLVCLSPLAGLAQNLEQPKPHPNPPLPYYGKVDAAIPAYQPVAHLVGSLRGVESNTVTNLMQLWIDGFTKIYPDVHFQVDIGGSGQGGPRLTAGSADFAFISREMMGRELAPYVEKLGRKPMDLEVSGGSLDVKAFTDAVVFVVNKANPLDHISFDQLDAIYSATHNRGIKTPITTWGQLGLTGDWADKPIHTWGVEIPNGYDVFVNMRVLANGQWKDGIQSLPTVIPLSDKVGADQYAISYTGLAWDSNPNTKVLSLSIHNGGPYISPTFQTVASQAYPLSRVIYMFFNQQPDHPLNPLLLEFFRYILSRQGQQQIVKDGIFTPLPAALDAQQREWLARAEHGCVCAQ
ncbi:MAG TPA: substrate-binding domain-containing protein [Terracidiphilus sp.]|nr:substrate-binding domain-containing protein [Terracidiphilus sp.]